MPFPKCKLSKIDILLRFHVDTTNPGPPHVNGDCGQAGGGGGGMMVSIGLSLQIYTVPGQPLKLKG